MHFKKKFKSKEDYFFFEIQDWNLQHGDRWEEKWEETLFPSYMRDGKLKKISSLPTYPAYYFENFRLALNRPRLASLSSSFIIPATNATIHGGGGEAGGW